MIRSAVLRLSLLYLAIVMAICIGFSLLLYSVATSELDHELRHPSASQTMSWSQQLDFETFRSGRLEEGRRHIRASLVLLNIVTLAAAGGLSYYAARRTLRPIGEALEAQSRFASDASHELRTPLAAMRAEIEVMLRDEDATGEELSDQLRSNLEEITKLQHLSDSLLRLARQTDPHQSFGPVSLSFAVQTGLKRLKKAAAQKEIAFKVDIPNDLRAIGDAAALAELFYVFLDKAVKYSPPKGTVRVTARSQTHAVTVEVSDDGPGIAPDSIPHIFKRFYRADSSRNKTAISGYGLGLAIADKIARQHGGTIKVSSQPGQGAAFSVQLPKATAVTSRAE